MFFRLWVIGWLTAGLVFSGPTLAAGREGAIPPLLESLRLEKTLTFCGEAVPLEDPEVRECMEKELLLSLWDRDQAIQVCAFILNSYLGGTEEGVQCRNPREETL